MMLSGGKLCLNMWQFVCGQYQHPLCKLHFADGNMQEATTTEGEQIMWLSSCSKYVMGMNQTPRDCECTRSSVSALYIQVTLQWNQMSVRPAKPEIYHFYLALQKYGIGTSLVTPTIPICTIRQWKTYVGIPCFVPLSPQDSGEEELVDGKTDHKLKGAVGFFTIQLSSYDIVQWMNIKMFCLAMFSQIEFLPVWMLQ